MKYLTCDGTVNQRDEVRGTYFEEGSVLLTAADVEFLQHVLPIYAERMHETAQQMRDEADRIEVAPKPEPKPGHIDVTPHPDALRSIAPTFEAQADKAIAFARDLQGPEDTE